MRKESDSEKVPCKLVLFSRKFHPQYLRDHPEDKDLIPDDIPYDDQIASLKKRKDELLAEIRSLDERIEKIEDLIQ